MATNCILPSLKKVGIPSDGDQHAENVLLADCPYEQLSAK